MSTAEAIEIYDRRNFITLEFARKRTHHSKITRPPHAYPVPPQPNEPQKFNRRRFLTLIGGTAAAATLIAGGIKFWELSHQETLESLVSQARKMESRFKDSDLSDESKRNNYTAILADIYSKDSPSNWTGQQITQTLIWTKNMDEFINAVMVNSQRRRGKKGRDYFADVPMLTTDNKKIVVNLASPAFKTDLLKQRVSGDWNALKSLRRFLLHEFTHLTTTPKRDQEFINLTDLSKEVQNHFMDGFVLEFSEIERDASIFSTLNELVVETIAAERSNKLFGLTPPIPYIEDGVDLRTAQTRLRQILTAAKITIPDLEKYNKTSDFYGFLTNLSSKIDFPAGTSLANRINYVLGVLDAVLYNDQNLIREYITKAA